MERKSSSGFQPERLRGNVSGFAARGFTRAPRPEISSSRSRSKLRRNSLRSRSGSCASSRRQGDSSINPTHRAHAATFAGAFLITLVYSTKPDPDSAVTLARKGDIAVVVDTAGDSLHIGPSVGAVTLESPDVEGEASDITLPPPAPGLASPATLVGDIAALRAQSDRKSVV